MQIFDESMWNYGNLSKVRYLDLIYYSKLLVLMHWCFVMFLALFRQWQIGSDHVSMYTILLAWSNVGGKSVISANLSAARWHGICQQVWTIVCWSWQQVKWTWHQRLWHLQHISGGGMATEYGNEEYNICQEMLTEKRNWFVIHGMSSFAIN